MDYSHYKQLDQEADGFFYQKKYDEVLRLMDYAETRFPEQLFYSILYKAYVYVLTGDHDKCIAALQGLIQQGWYCPLDDDHFEPLWADPRFQALGEGNDRLLAQAPASAKMEYAVHLPTDYSPGRCYPLFIVLHGDGLGGNIEYQRWYWEPDTMTSRGLIAVYVQSSQVAFPGHFRWLEDYQIAKRDIQDCYNQVTAQYAVDPANIILGGFSGGAIMSVEIAMADVLPVKGIVGLCPELRPKSFTRENVERAVGRGMKGVFMEGQIMWPMPEEQAMLDVFQTVRFPYQFYINQGVGHVFPQDFGEKLGQAIAFVMS